MRARVDRPRVCQLRFRGERAIARTLEIALRDRAGFHECFRPLQLALGNVVCVLRRPDTRARRKRLIANRRVVEAREHRAGAYTLARLRECLQHRTGKLGPDGCRAFRFDRAGECGAGANFLGLHDGDVLRTDEDRARRRRRVRGGISVPAARRRECD